MGPIVLVLTGMLRGNARQDLESQNIKLLQRLIVIRRARSVFRKERFGVGYPLNDRADDSDETELMTRASCR